MSNKRIGLCGGSFDPIHFGHLNLAIEMMEAHQLDEVWFCPAARNPHKIQNCHINDHDRFEMISLAIEGEPRFRILDIEISRPPPSYSIDTLHQIIEKNPFDQFYLIIGEDVARSFHRWYQAEEIIKYVHLLVGERIQHHNKIDFEGSSAIVAAIVKGLTPMRIMEMSSTELRERLAEGLYCEHLMPRKVLDYITSHRLY